MRPADERCDLFVLKDDIRREIEFCALADEHGDIPVMDDERNALERRDRNFSFRAADAGEK